ncbi:MAG: GLUG motif-containing protein [Desulfocapsaceae bacterium]|nr:GLUG motif-containing protein [Desulfocapsaceae bacterium]
MGNDIDCSGAGVGWEPIGTIATPFSGSLDGQGYEISGLVISRETEDNIGLFGVTGLGSEIKNIGVVAVTIAGDDIVGALVGDNQGTITDSYSTGTFTYTYSEAGGLVGNNHGVIHNSYSTISISVPSGGEGGGLVGYNYGTITHSHATGAVSGYEYLGGLVGRNDGSGSISDSYASGNVTGTGNGGDYSGGFVGHNAGVISRSYATGSATGYDTIGGFVGKNDGGIIHDSYATGNATGTSGYVGGFVGANDFGAQISNSYSVGYVTGSGDVGGFAGYIWDTIISNSFYDLETSGQSDTGKGEPKTTLQMKDITTFTNAGWDFVSTWGIDASENNGYPYLLWHYTVGGVVSGLAPGNSVVVQNNLGDDLTVTADGDFVFSTALDDGSAYAVSVLTQPTGPNQFCTVTNGTGILSGEDVSNVDITCRNKFPWTMFLPTIIRVQ